MWRESDLLHSRMARAGQAAASRSPVLTSAAPTAAASSSSWLRTAGCNANIVSRSTASSCESAARACSRPFTADSAASGAPGTVSPSRLVNHLATSAQRQSLLRCSARAAGGGKSPGPRSPVASSRTLSRVRPLRLAISASVTYSSGATRTTRTPGTACSTAVIAPTSASASERASRSKCRCCTPAVTPIVASSQPASNNASCAASLCRSAPSTRRVNSWVLIRSHLPMVWAVSDRGT